jgi:hypothetical protein
MENQLVEMAKQTATAQNQLAEMAKQTGAMQAQIDIARSQLGEAISATNVAKAAADAAEKSNLIAANAARMDLRAYVNVVLDDNPKLVPIVNGGALTGYSLMLPVQNAGKTPAHNVNINCEAKFMPPDFKGRLRTTPLNGRNMTLGPNRKTTLRLQVPMTDEDRRIGHVVWIYGIVNYDALGFPAFTLFRLRQAAPGSNDLLIEDEANQSENWNLLYDAPGAMQRAPTPAPPP